MKCMKHFITAIISITEKLLKRWVVITLYLHTHITDITLNEEVNQGKPI